MRCDNLSDVNNTYQRVMHFDNVGIDHLIRLGEANYKKGRPPLEAHTHKDAFEIVVFETGAQKYNVNQKTYIVHSNELFITLPNEVHGSAQYLEERSHLYYLIFSFQPGMAEFLAMTPEEIRLTEHLLFSLQNRIYSISKSIFPLLQNIFRLYFSETPFRISRIRCLATEMFVAILSAIQESKHFPLQKGNALYDEMTAFIHQNISQKILLKDVAKQVHLSESRVKQIFRENGFTFHDYILRQKIEIAKEMLYYTECSITDIAYQLGFSSSQHFSQIFCQYTLQSPGNYRKQNQSSKR